MVADGLRMLETIFASVVSWFSQLMDAVGGRVYVVAGFLILLVCSLLLAPLRGSALSAFGDFTNMQTHNDQVQRNTAKKERAARAAARNKKRG